MEGGKKGKALDLMAFLLLLLVSQEVVTPAISRTLGGGLVDQKNTSLHHDAASHRTPCVTPSHAGGGHGAPSHHRPSTSPWHGGGGYYTPPPVPAITTPPTPIVGRPVTPSPLVPLVPPTPMFPAIPTPPKTPLIPLDPNIFPFTCNYWRTQMAAIWGLIGYWGTVGQLFGAPAAAAFGRNLSLPEALANTRTDGMGALYREGTTSLLNSLVSKSFVFSSQQVMDAFNAAVASDKAAAAQARLFKKANEGHLKHY